MTEQRTLQPWLGHRLRIQAPDVIVTDGCPLAQITIYDDLTLLTRNEKGRWTSHPISADGLAQTLSRVPSVTGLLPQHTLGTGRINGTPFYVLYVPPRVRRLRTEQREYRIPVPPLVWAGCGQDYRIWALDASTYPTGDQLQLLVAPFPNCYNDGRICWGSSDSRRDAAPETLLPALDLFLEASYFNQHLANGKSVQFPTSVLAQWELLSKQRRRRYPVSDLVPTGRSLSWVLTGGPWGGS